MDETGYIEEILPNGEATIIVERSAACAGCAMQGVCFTEDSKILRVKSRIDFPAEKGKRVRLQLDASNFMKYSFITYMVPVLLIIVGAALGDAFQDIIGLGQLSAVLPAIAGLAAGIFFVRYYSKKLERSEKVVIKVLNDAG